MPLHYDLIAGQSTERLAALSDGIFGVAMTLLLLELHVPDPGFIHTEFNLLHTTAQLLPQLGVYATSFLTLGIFWVGQQTQLNSLTRSDRHLTWIHLAFLFAVTLMPFSTRLLASFIAFRVALLLYWGNILLLGAILYASWGWSTRAALLREQVTLPIQAAICRRIVIAQALYAAATAFCVFGNRWSIALILLVQLNYAVSPRTWGRRSAPAAGASLSPAQSSAD